MEGPGCAGSDPVCRRGAGRTHGGLRRGRALTPSVCRGRDGRHRPPPRTDPYLRRYRILCGLQNYVAPSRQCPLNQRAGGSGRHIIPLLERVQKRHQRRIIAPPPLRCACIRNLAFCQSLGLPLQIDFCIDVGRVQRNMAEPRANGVEVHAGAEQVRGRRMANRVRADPR